MKGSEGLQGVIYSSSVGMKEGERICRFDFEKRLTKWVNWG